MNSTSDALLILERLPELVANLKEKDKRKLLNAEYLYSVLAMLEKYIELLDPWAIRDDADMTRAIKHFSIEAGGKVEWIDVWKEPAAEEAETHRRLVDHREFLAPYVDPQAGHLEPRSQVYYNELYESLKGTTHRIFWHRDAPKYQNDVYEMIYKKLPEYPSEG